MQYTKEEIEKRLVDMLYEILRGHNQEDGIRSLVYDEENQVCTVKLDVHIVKEDDYIGFAGY